MDPIILSAILVSLIAGGAACRRRLVFALGPEGPTLAPGFLVIVWLGAFCLGQAWGSLAGMAWTAAAAIALLALAAVKKSKPRRLRGPHWTRLDLLSMLMIGLALLGVPLDTTIHHWLMGTFVRGNIPPCAPNDPGTLLAYHTLFTAAAAALSKAFALWPDLAMNAVSVFLLAVLLTVLIGLSGLFFRGPRTRQAARFFFLFGFGPIYLRSQTGYKPYWVLHGMTNQSFAESVFRPPTMLGFLLFLWLTAALAPLLPSAGRPERGPRRAPHTAFLLPALLLLPHASEEISFFAVFALAGLAGAGLMSRRWAALGIAAVALSFLTTGIGQAMLHPSFQSIPQAAFVWPPILPSWSEETSSWSMPLWSWRALRRLFLEWGPLYFCVWPALMRDARRRTGPLLFLAGLLPACLLTTGTLWGNRPDFDRFLFAGTAFGFFLAAAWVERLEEAAAAGRRLYASALLIIFYAAVTAGPLGCLAFRTIQSKNALRQLASEFFPASDPLSRRLSAVGPRDLVLTNRVLAPYLVSAGFVVAAPMNSNVLGEIDMYAFDDYVANLKRKPDWLLLPEGDPRLAGKKQVLEFNGYLLAKSSP